MTNGKILKVCGMREEENIRQVEVLGADWLGFIFYPKSPRYVTGVPTYLPTRAKRVGVFVNESQENIEVAIDRFGLEAIQLHGNESPEFCNSIRRSGVNVIKTILVKHPDDLNETDVYENVCDYFLFDTKCDGYGGSGNQFDWEILKDYKGNVPFLLSGGIHENSARHLKAVEHPLLIGYDINSCFETTPGLKDIERIRKFINALNF